MTAQSLTRDAVLRVGEVVAIEGRRVFIEVDKKKNASHLFFDGDVMTNVGVNGFLEIRKGFVGIIGRVEGERLQSDSPTPNDTERRPTDLNKRILTVVLTGHFDELGVFTGGMKELPLIGNEAFLVTRQQHHRIHDLVRGAGMSVSIATLYGDDLEFPLPVDGLFNSHIAIFGNTGSGKSNTLAHLYQEFVRKLEIANEASFRATSRFILFDFNGEYSRQSCITPNKATYNLSTRTNDGDKIPLDVMSLLDVEVLSILADATEKTQKPFIARALRLLTRIRDAGEADAPSFFKNLLRKYIKQTLQMTDKVKAFLLIDYFKQVLPEEDADGNQTDFESDIDWYNTLSEFKFLPTGEFLSSHPDTIPSTLLYQAAEQATFGNNLLSDILQVLYLQLVADVLANRAQNDHIAPVINRLKRKRVDIDKVFHISENPQFWQSNFVVINLIDTNLEMRKTIPLLLSKRLYGEQKRANGDTTLTIIIDEAHNILSTESFREAESWKDYRLETFEEIIKEGRKFGVFVTIASQRPNDISPTITSQAHNYFIHRLINDLDLKTIASVVSYIDRTTQESIPTLATGTCIFSGVIATMPVKINVRPLPISQRPASSTRKFAAAVDYTEI